MRHLARGLATALLLSAIAATGCYQPHAADCQLACVEGTRCPTGFTCRADGYCHAPSDTALCASDAAPPDVTVDDPDAAIAPATSLAAGARHTCAVTDGRLTCWGDNARGQLGPGRGVYEPAPREVAITSGGAVTSDWTQVAAGREFTCGRRGGGVFCWGADESGQIGQVATPVVAIPTQVTLPAAATDLCTGGHHACAVVAGTVHCWGDGSAGQRGDASAAIAAHTPRPIASARTDWTDVACGDAHTCARAGGDLYCWGALGNQRLGRPATAADHDRPTTTPALVGAGRYALGASHTCAETTAGLTCWGTFDGSNGLPPTAVRLPGLTAAALISAGGRDTCAGEGATIYCWGGGSDGDAGDGTFTERAGATVAVADLAPVVALASGEQFTCAALAAGGLRCWGNNSHGQLGTGVAATGFGPTRVGTGTDWVAVSAGDETTCGVTAAGAMSCWGANLRGETGDTAPGPIVDEPRAVSVPGVPGLIWRQVVAGQRFACGRNDGGATYCWGDAIHGQLGGVNDGAVHAPAQIAIGAASELARAAHGVCAVVTGPARTCWGDNTDFALGLATAQDDAPIAMVPGTWSQVALGVGFGCSIGDLGDVACWGSDRDGQRGDGTGVTAPSAAEGLINLGTPVQPVTALAAAFRGTHACAVREGALWCWGDGNAYALGTGDDVDRFTPAPVTVPASAQWTAITAGARATCGVHAGALYCWGTNDARQLGVASVDPISRPRQIDAGPGWTAVSAGTTHACGIKAGALYCWGLSRFGAIGVPGAHNHATPVAPLP